MTKKKKVCLCIALAIILLAGIFLVRFYFIKRNQKQEQKIETFNSAKEAQKFKDDCADKEKKVCYPTKFLKLARTQGYNDAFNTLLQIQKIDPSTQDCHLIAHSIGRGSYEHDTVNWKSTLKMVDDSCYYGILHGLIESYLFETGQQLALSTIEEICPYFTSPDCYHVMGHVFILNEGGNLNKGLSDCTGIFKNQAFKQSDCQAGVFMEYQLPEGLYEHGIVSKDGLDSKTRMPGLEKMCAGYLGNTGVVCWLEIAHVAAAAYNNDMSKVFEECGKANVLKSIDICLRHGLQIVWAANKYSLMDFVNFCPYNNKIDAGFETYCNSWLVGNSIFMLNYKQKDILPYCYAIKPKFRTECLMQASRAVN